MEYWSYPEFSKSIESDRVRVDCGFDACPLFVQKIWHVANERGGGFDTPLESWKWFAYLRMHLIIRAQGGWQKFLLVRNTKWQNRFLEEEWKQAFGLRELNSRSQAITQRSMPHNPSSCPGSLLGYWAVLLFWHAYGRLLNHFFLRASLSHAFLSYVSETTEHLFYLVLGMSSLTGRPLLLLQILETTL
jgi:hypothetical protein